MARVRRLMGQYIGACLCGCSSKLSKRLNIARYIFEQTNRIKLGFRGNEQSNPLQAYGTRVFSDDIKIAGPAATQWNAYESSIMSLLPRAASNTSTTPVEVEVARARVQIHYILNNCFVGNRDLLAEAKALSAIPTTIIQGRYDMVCPPISAWELKNAMPHAKFLMIADAGHSAMDTGITSALIEATEAFKISHQ